MDAKARRGLNELTVTEIVAKIAAGEMTCEAVTRDCIERIIAREPVVKAWVKFNPELALAQAHALDREPRRGALHGVPIGIKDVIDTFDMPTEMGSPIYRGYRPTADAACVALLRRAGAVILGKTATCELAGMAPAATTNPHDPAHTPGGSSSGSAAAVADVMVPAALGTQTGGSVLRPSSFCGVFGYKPTYNTFNKAGLKPAAESIDTIGWIARSIEDIALLTAVLGMDEPQPLRSISAAPRIGLCRTELWDAAQPETKSAVENAAAALSKAGAVVRDVDLPGEFTGLPALARGTINHFERAACMAFEWDNHRGALSPQMRRYIENGLKTSRVDYVAAWRRVEQCRTLLLKVFDGIDVLLTPCVPGEAPKGLASTGDPSMQAMWTALHTPTMTLPTHRGPNNLPVGIQLVAQRYGDDRLFACARWIWDRIGAPDMIGVSRV
ncbi:MAG TPA: amidase [Xanthobacteraceae bacterium]|jgi:Asp-tRNA(Asn)/Glu-tRNA(Gln) amidotransferase A subunit family amidase|nr:amidase [Xanthobacteraceae bacterium]